MSGEYVLHVLPVHRLICMLVLLLLYTCINKVCTGQDMVRTIFLQCQGKIRAVYFELGKIKILKKGRKNCNRNTTDLLALKAGKAIGSL